MSASPPKGPHSKSPEVEIRDTGEIRPQWSFVSEATFLAAVWAICYLGAYKYEVAYCNRWRLPEEFISISLEAIASLSITAWFLLLYLPLFPLVRNLIAPLKRLGLMIPTTLLLFLTITLYVNEELREVWWLLTSFVALIIAIWLGVPAIIAWRRRITYRSAVEVSNEIDSRSPDWMTWLISRVGAMAFPLGGFLLIAFIGGDLAGVASARSQKKFTILESDIAAIDSCHVDVLVRVYDGRMYCATVDTCEHQIASDIFLVSAEELAKLRTRLKPKYIGRLDFSRIHPD